jgi:hypothetical protein
VLDDHLEVGALEESWPGVVFAKARHLRHVRQLTRLDGERKRAGDHL